MWKGVLPAVTTKFAEDGTIDRAETLRTMSLQIDAGCDGIIVAGSLGEGSMLSHDERLELIAIARDAAGKRPVLLTVAEAATRDAADLG
eukprot:gene36211-43049_t